MVSQGAFVSCLAKVVHACVSVCAIARSCPTQTGNSTDYILVPGHIVKTLLQQNKTIVSLFSSHLIIFMGEES